MPRHASLAILAVSLLSSVAAAADAPTTTAPAHYGATAKATRSGDDTITIAIKLTTTQNEADGRPLSTTLEASPKLKLRDGQRAQMAMGTVNARVQDAKPHPHPGPGAIDSGYMIDVISIKGRDELLMVTTLVEDGQTIWADAATVKVAPEPADAKH